jgi:hypothetical protein
MFVTRFWKNYTIQNHKNTQEEEVEVVVDWDGNVNNDPDYEPTTDETLYKLASLFFKELIHLEFKKQFPFGLVVERENIRLAGNLANIFKLYIEVEGVEVYFRIDLNDGEYETLTGNFVASGLKIGELQLQDTTESFLKYGNNFKMAQTLENIVAKEIRFLKTCIKQEISYLEQNILSAEDKLKVANLFQLYYTPFLDNKQIAKLTNIVIKTESILEEKEKLKNKQKIELDNEIEEEDNTDNKTELNKVSYDLEFIKTQFKDEIFKSFNLENEKIKFDFKTTEKSFLLEAIISGQKINLNIFMDDKLTVSSTNTIGTGKSDLNQLEVKGKTLEEKLKKAIILSAKPILIRQIENLANIFKGNQYKKISKELEVNLKEICNSITDFSIDIFDKVSFIKDKINIVIDTLSFLDKKSVEGFIDVLDKILKLLHNEMTKNIDFDFMDNFDFTNYSLDRSLSTKFKNLLSNGETLVEVLNNLKNNLNRLIDTNILVINLNSYKKVAFVSEKDEKYLEELENKIKFIADSLSEDIVLGSASRKVLGLMSSSISNKDNLFKYNIENVVKEIIKIRNN